MSRLFRKVEIADILNYDNIGADWGIFGEIDGETLTIISSNDCGHILIDRYGERCIYIPDNTPLDDYAYLLKLWRIWLDVNKADYLRAFKALQLEYDPIANYDSHEVTTSAYGKVIDETYTPRVTSTTDHRYTPGIQDVTESQLYGFNSESGSDSDKVTNSKTGTDTNTTTVTKTGVDTNNHTTSGRDTVTVDRSGNIGVTRTQEMIADEIRLRMRDYGDMVLKRFLDEYTTY